MSIERKMMAHYVDASTTGTPSYVRLGQDLEEYTVELNPETDEKQNILGESSVKVKGYTPSASVDPFYCEKGEALFEKLQKIVDERKTGDDLKSTTVEVHLWTEAESGAYEAYREDCLLVPNTYGGDTAGYAIQFDVKHIGNRVKGTFNPTTKTFTEAE